MSSLIYKYCSLIHNFREVKSISAENFSMFVIDTDTWRSLRGALCTVNPDIYIYEANCVTYSQARNCKI